MGKCRTVLISISSSSSLHNSTRTAADGGQSSEMCWTFLEHLGQMNRRCSGRDDPAPGLTPRCDVRFPLKKCGGGWPGFVKGGAAEEWGVRWRGSFGELQSKKQLLTLKSFLPFEGNPKPGQLRQAALVESVEEMQCDTNRLEEEVLMD